MKLHGRMCAVECQSGEEVLQGCLRRLPVPVGVLRDTRAVYLNSNAYSVEKIGNHLLKSAYKAARGHFAKRFFLERSHYSTGFRHDS